MRCRQQAGGHSRAYGAKRAPGSLVRMARKRKESGDAYILMPEKHAISILKKDHATVKDLFDRFEKAQSRTIASPQ
jgi:hypothetical protein